MRWRLGPGLEPHYATAIKVWAVFGVLVSVAFVLVAVDIFVFACPAMEYLMGAWCVVALLLGLWWTPRQAVRVAAIAVRGGAAFVLACAAIESAEGNYHWDVVAPILLVVGLAVCVIHGFVGWAEAWATGRLDDLDA